WVLAAPIPRHLKPARPNPEPFLSGGFLLAGVGALAVPRPIDGPAAAHDRGVNVAGLGSAHRDNPAVAVPVARIAGHNAVAGQLDHHGSAVPAAFVGLPVPALAILPGLGRVDAP